MLKRFAGIRQTSGSRMRHGAVAVAADVWQPLTDKDKSCATVDSCCLPPFDAHRLGWTLEPAGGRASAMGWRHLAYSSQWSLMAKMELDK
ncbi:hypothetical protein AWZ03_007260 [Drosophila navojoa]|uniref:Uncharacterized protein n=1 Tax=Drosophila navojoa TaxID=7232 RepID=A0A484BC58_DRONA|nr:hypothetical protein AWZ03_007260 [Drosophila navojoa]